MFMAVVFFAAVDRLLKALAIASQPEINLIGGWLRLVLAKNPGIAFSLPVFGRWLVIIIFLIIIALVYLFILKIKKNAYFQAVFYFSIIIGAASNLYDRLKYGFVIDYFNLKYYSIFNLADGLILLGIVGLLVVVIDKNSKAC